jgi:hypothetical protein
VCCGKTSLRPHLDGGLLNLFDCARPQSSCRTRWVRKFEND